jgi:uncharacterized protein
MRSWVTVRANFRNTLELCYKVCCNHLFFSGDSIVNISFLTLFIRLSIDKMASQLEFQFVNSNATPPSPTSTSFQLTADPATDIWRKVGPPGVHRFNAPILYKSIPVSSFKRARVTVSANWATQYDQGGLIFVLPQADGTKKWIKSGIEFYQNKVFVSTVAADRGADMSLAQLGLRGIDGNEVTTEFRRGKDSLWVYVIDGDTETPIREITWVLGDGEKTECWVGVYVARPSASAEWKKQGLVADYRGFELNNI